MRYMSLCEICTPKQWPTLTLKQLSGKGFPVYGANGIIGYHDIYNHEQATVMIGCRGTCGQVTISEEKAYINGNAMCLDNLSDSYDKKFILYYLQNYDFSEIITGSSQPQITRESLKKVLIPIVSKEVQLNVVSHFDKLYELIVARRLQLAKLDQLVKSQFIELFGDVVCNSKSWQMRVFADIASSRLGKMLDAKQQTGKCSYPYLANFNVQWFRFNLDNLNQMDFDEDDRIEFELKDGDLLVCEGGEIGRCAVWHNETQPCYFQKALHRVRCNRQIIHPDYLAWWFKYNCDHDGFAAIAGAKATIAHLPGAKLKQLQVAVPPLELQEQFTVFLKQTDKSKLAIQQSLDKLELLKKSLMQEYFG